MVNEQEIKVVDSAKVRATVVPDEPLDDNTISLKAKGLYAVIMHTGRIGTNKLANLLKEGKSSVANTLAELEENNYLEKEGLRDATGKFNGYRGKLLLGVQAEEKDSGDSSSYKTHQFFDTLSTVTDPWSTQYWKTYLDFAERLAELIKNIYGTSTKSKSRIKSWASDIEKLYRIDGVSNERISNALSGCDKSLGGEYFPMVQGGTSFRKKFIQIEQAIKREGGGMESSPDDDVKVEYDNLGNKWINGRRVYE